MALIRYKIVSRWIIVFLLVSLMVAQGALLDQYFYSYYEQHGWKSFICAYFPAVALLVWQQVVETRAGDPLTERQVFNENLTRIKTLKRKITGYHKMFTWFLYVVPSIIQYVWILNTFVRDIEPSSFFGPRFLRVILCFPPGVFLLLDTIEYALKPELNVEWWRVFDLFDTVELLQILLVDKNTSLPINRTTKSFMLLFGSTSLLFPAFSLWELQACRKIPSEAETAGSNKSSSNERTRLISRVRIISKVCQLLFVNLAFLAIRLVLFFDFNLDASVFIAKNVIALAVGIIEIISACRGKRAKQSQQNMNLRATFQNSAFESTSDSLPDNRSLSQTTANSSSSRTVASDFPNDQQKPIKPEELGVSSYKLSRRNPALYRDPENLLTYPCSSILDGNSFDSNISETSLRVPSHIGGATFTKITESRSTQTTIPEIESDHLYCQLCGSQKIPRLAVERCQNTTRYTESVSGDSRFCSPGDTSALESDKLSSVLEKTTGQKQCFSRKNPPKKFESPRVKEGYFETQTPLRASTFSLDPCDDSKLALSSDRRVKAESVKPFPNLGSNGRLNEEHDTSIEESNNLFSSRLRSRTKQEESFSEMKNFRREQLDTVNPKVQSSFNSRSEELNQNAYRSPSLDYIRADSDTDEIHLGFPSLDNGPKRSSERPEKESAIRQYKRHQRNRCHTYALESDQLCSFFQKTTRQEQRFPKQNPPRKFESPRITEAKESKLRYLALQQKKTREQGYSETKTSLRESTVSLDPYGDSKLALASDKRVKESVNPFSNLCSNGGLSKEHDTRIEELNRLFSSRLRSMNEQEESFSERKNFRRKTPATRKPRVQLSSNTRSKQLNAYCSPSLDHLWADNETSGKHQGFTSLTDGPKRSSERPEKESAIRQYKKHQRNRRCERNMHSSAFTVWNTTN